MKKLSLVLAAVLLATSLCVPAAADSADAATLLSQADCYINFDDGIVDVTGNYEVVGVGEPRIVDGVIGNAAKAKGGESYISIPDMQFGTDSFTITAWIKANSHTSDPVLFGNKSWDSGKNVGWLLCVRDNDLRFNASSDKGGATRTDTTYAFTTRGEWVHVAVVVDADAHTYTLYLDGRQQGEPTSYSYLEKTGQWDSGLKALSFNIGEDGTGKYNNGMNYNVDFDEVAIFKSVLTTEEVRAISNYGEPEALDPVDAFLNTADLRISFENGEIKDANGNYDVVTVGNVDLIEGRTGDYAANLVGGNYISIPEMEFGTNSFTITAWIKPNSHSSDPVLFGNKSWSSGKNVGWLLAIRDNDLRINLSTDSNGVTRKDKTYPYNVIGEWTHVAVVFDAENLTYSLFINGKKQGDPTPFEIAEKGSFDAPPAKIVFNVGDDGTGTYNADCNFNVDFDDVTIFKSVLSADQIAAIADYTTEEEVDTAHKLPDDAFFWRYRMTFFRNNFEW